MFLHHSIFARICSQTVLPDDTSTHKCIAYVSYLVQFPNAFRIRRHQLKPMYTQSTKYNINVCLGVDLNISYSHHIEVNELNMFSLTIINKNICVFHLSLHSGSSANHYGQPKTLPRQRDDDHEFNSRQWCRPSGNQQSWCWGCRSVGQNAGADQSTADAEHICGSEQWQRFAVRSTVHDDGAQSHRKRVEHFERVFFAGRKSSE